MSSEYPINSPVRSFLRDFPVVVKRETETETKPVNYGREPDITMISIYYNNLDQRLSSSGLLTLTSPGGWRAV